MAGLLDFLQGASNAAASNVSGPVDMISWLLRKGGMGGVIGEAPVGSSAWMAQKGLTRQTQGAAGLLGEAAGLSAPIVAAAKAPQIAAGLLQMGDNLAAPRTLGTQRGVLSMGSDLPDWFDDFKAIGGGINPDGTVTVFHRTTPQSAESIRKFGVMRGKEDGLFFSSLPDGQAANYGDAVLEFRIPANQLMIDDLFANEAHFRLPTKRALQSVKVADWLKK